MLSTRRAPAGDWRKIRGHRDFRPPLPCFPDDQTWCPHVLTGNESTTIRLDGSLKDTRSPAGSDMVAWSTMVWELAVGDTVVLTFIWPHVGTMAEFATMFGNGGYVGSLSLIYEAPPQTGEGVSARLPSVAGIVNGCDRTLVGPVFPDP